MNNRKSLILLMTLFAGLLLGRSAGGKDVLEYSVKAAYLFNFAKFVQWPADAFESNNAPIVIGVIGKNPFKNDLDDAIQGKMIDQRPIAVRRFEGFGKTQASQLRKCHILFISYSEKRNARDILAALNGAPVLTVSEVENFPLLGGMILFDRVGKKIGLIVQPTAAQKARLEISSRLLQISKIFKVE